MKSRNWLYLAIFSVISFFSFYGFAADFLENKRIANEFRDKLKNLYSEAQVQEQYYASMNKVNYAQYQNIPGEEGSNCAEHILKSQESEIFWRILKLNLETFISLFIQLMEVDAPLISSKSVQDALLVLMIQIGAEMDKQLEDIDSIDASPEFEKMISNATQAVSIPGDFSEDIWLCGSLFLSLEKFLSNLAAYQNDFKTINADLFIEGMQSVEHAQLLEAMFKPKSQTQFYLGRSRKNNDLIKLQVLDLDAYKKFCEDFLKKIPEERGVLTYFVKLHSIIKQSEKDLSKAVEALNELDRLSGNYKDHIIQTTGPMLLDNFNDVMSTNMEYPETFAGAWRTLDENLDEASAQPKDAVFRGFWPGWPGYEELEKSFEKISDNYRKYLSAAIYSKKFGKDHPFNKYIRQYLVDKFPYYSDEYKKLLNKNFEWHNKHSKKYDYEQISNKDNFSDDDFPEDNKLIPGQIYLKKEGDKIAYVYLGQQGPERGLLDLQIKQDDVHWRLRQRSKINEKFEEMGLFAIKGMPYERWKKKILDLYLSDVELNYHYPLLIEILKQLDIELPLVGEALIDKVMGR